MRWPKRRPTRLERQLAEAGRERLAGRLQEAVALAQEPSVPPSIHNPHGGTRSHYRDPDQAAARPVCGASGAVWAEGNGGLRMCGLCPHMWAQRQEQAAAS